VTPLAARLAARIRANGPLGVDAFMNAAVADPEFGYYAARDPLGASGDFITAPEISQVFGELIGLWCVALWQRLGEPPVVRLVEFGPGRGTLLADALRAIESTAAGCARAVRPVLIEISPHLRALQAAALATSPAAPLATWHDRFADVADGPALIIANEFFDALPVCQFVRCGDGWRERCVGLDAAGQRFVFVEGGPVPSPMPDDGEGLAAEGAIVERCPAGEDLAAAIAARVVQAGGAALIIDYGHPHLHPGDTVQAVRRHRFAEVLDRPGEADLSHHVDFGALAAAARAAGAAVFGPIPQGLFLGRLGIAERGEALSRAQRQRQPEIAAAIRRLIDPRRMGVLFKALAITPPDIGTPPGFAAASARRPAER
jgi:NADH dehydrogenase [ubiquinone] 1 alpha subcomplex assembly factor 7